MLGVLLKAYMRQAAAEKEAGLVLGHSRGLLTWSNRFLEAAAKVRTTYMGFIYWIFLNVLYLTLLHLPPPQIPVCRRILDRTQECCDFGIGSLTV
jgi:hypothetical protein